MPRTPRNPGAGKPPHNGPSNGPGAGSWATGQSAGGCTTFDELKSLAAIALRDDPEAKAVRDERAAAMLAVHFDVALHDPSGAARSNAADKALDRLLGKAVQKSQISGADGVGPLIVERVFVEPAVRQDAESL
jgi:hypothetical protein